MTRINLRNLEAWPATGGGRVPIHRAGKQAAGKLSGWWRVCIMRANRNERALVPPARASFEDIEVFVRVLITAAISLLHLTSAALARDDGRYQNVDPTIKAWIRGLTDKNGNGCCDTADGYPAEVEWDNRTGRYRVRVDGQWHVVPHDAVLETPNRLGYPMVWYYQVQVGSQTIFKIRCFLPGAGG